jgi:hypothetical protein
MDFKPDDYLNQVLEANDRKLGIGGTWAFRISIITHQGDSIGVPLVTIPNLTQEAAKQLYDLHDEHNYMVKINQNECYRLHIELMNEGAMEDESYLPNVFTEFTDLVNLELK